MKYFDVFLTALRLGLTSFGGPIAHLGYFHEVYVKKKKWITDEAYADLVALCQFLPGPASSQVGMAIGHTRAGVFGALLSWLGFTLPSALILTFFGLYMANTDSTIQQPWIHGLKVVAVAVVAQAVYGMGKKLCPDRERMTIAIVSCVAVLLTNHPFAQLVVLLNAGIFGSFFLKTTSELPHGPMNTGSKKLGAIFVASFLVLLVALPMLREIYAGQILKLVDSFYRSGSLVFGGGHVVLPLLQGEVVTPGWVSADAFMAGYGAANAIPGPLFAFTAYLGAVSSTAPRGWEGAAICLAAAFLPSFLLIIGVLPFWERLRRLPKLRQSILGINAAVVGILLAALYHPVWTSAVFSGKDFAMIIGGFLLLEQWKVPSWAVVILALGLSTI